MGVLNMYDWRADELSYSLRLPFFVLEGTLHDIEPKEFTVGDAIAVPWFMPAVFSAMAMTMGMWCTRHRQPSHT